jgi:5-methylcytosine-specific restriction endonuclease McrA
MIRIDRSPAPLFLLDPDQIWQKETQKAIQYYADKKPLKSFAFKCYRDERVKNELRAVFPKCAYCESIFDATSDGDIEHFRPKLRVSGKTPETPGYYWLANSWENLLLSCSHCNQGRLHNIYDPVTETVKKSSIRLGKVDQFPLKPGGVWIANHQDDVSKEEPFRLLINPCVDDPEAHFEYDETLAVMKPKTEMANVSISVYALSRSILIDRRRAILATLLLHLQLLRMELEDYDFHRSERSKEKIKMHWKVIREMTAVKAQYAGMCRYFVKRFLNVNKITI